MSENSTHIEVSASGVQVYLQHSVDKKVAAFLLDQPPGPLEVTVTGNVRMVVTVDCALDDIVRVANGMRPKRVAAAAETTEDL